MYPNKSFCLSSTNKLNGVKVGKYVTEFNVLFSVTFGGPKCLLQYRHDKGPGLPTE
uniref:Uncharacterized protein n=1 Tax=Anguilla anguilla TaxID=7936 RepID=A0A0E9XMK1_ANGAN